LLLLVGHGLARALTGARIGLGALAADRQALAMADAAVALDIDQALDVHAHLGAQIAFDLVARFDGAAELADFVIGQVPGLLRAVHIGLLANIHGGLASHAEDIGQRNLGTLVIRNIDAS